MLMHKDEIYIDKEIVERLISIQFPEFSHLPIQKFKSIGTVNAIYKIGEKHYARLPRLAWANEALHQEWDVLSMISKDLTFNIPKVIKKGIPSEDYPLDWAIYGWIDGDTYDNSSVDEISFAKALARFIIELRSIKIPTNAPKAGRKPLRELDKITVEAIEKSKDDIDWEKALYVWRELLNAELWNRNPVWIHADLLQPNLLINKGELSAIIDFGSSGVGDPAFDIVPAWSVLTSKTRDMFRELLDVDNGTWLRAKAYALHQALLIIHYYRGTNLEFVKQAKFTVGNIL